MQILSKTNCFNWAIVVEEGSSSSCLSPFTVTKVNFVLLLTGCGSWIVEVDVFDFWLMERDLLREVFTEEEFVLMGSSGLEGKKN